MSKRTFIAFGIFVAVLAVGVPWLVFQEKGDADAGGRDVPAKFANAQELFDINCGNCHTLYAAGTDGNYGPDLDAVLAPAGPVPEEQIETTEQRVLTAIEQGVDGGAPGRMPAGILNETQAEEVAAFVAATAGEG